MSFKVGDKGENIVADYFENIGYEVIKSPDKKFYAYDLECNHWEYSFTIEVKTDVSAYRYAKQRGEPDNPRLFIEYYNETMNEPSGITMSEATYYFYLIINNNNDVECNVFKRLELFNYLNDSETYTRTLIPKYNDHTTTGWLPYLEDLKSEGLLKKQWLIAKW